MLAHTRPAQFPVFLDSAAEGPLTRYSMLAFEPSAALLRDAQGRLTARGAARVGDGGFLDNLDAWLRREATPRDDSKPLPFMGGWLVYLSYELAQEVEPVLRLPSSADPYSAFALRVEHLAVHEHATGTLYAISQNGDATTHARLIARLEEAARGPLTEGEEIPRVDRWAEEPPEKYLQRVRRALEY